MVVGSGLIAKTFKIFASDTNILVFASGVSNSNEKNDTEFFREELLLLKHLKENNNNLFIYFSTCSVYDKTQSNSKYVIHKLKMESIVQKHSSNYFIIRLPNVAGFSGNKNTLINHFIDSIKRENRIEIWKNATRNVIDADDVLAIVQRVIIDIKRNQIINVANPINYKVVEIVNEIEQHISIKSIYSIVDKGIEYKIDINNIRKILTELKIDFSRNYLNSILKKYYPR